MKLKPLPFALIALIPGLVLAENNLSTITVNADLRETSETDIAASVDIMDEAELQDRGATHFGDVLLQTPNVNFSGQSSRPRHIQIRGMGERDEYTGAPNASVGFAVDEIDFSGIGMVGNLFDVKQVEVLRGPQSTRYGASALAGLVNIQTNDPTPYKESLIEASVGTDNLKELGVMTSGAFTSEDKSPQYRVSLFKHNSDGFRDNDTLDRTDTNQKNELTARAKLRWWAGDDTQFDLSLMHADINNGYDVFTRDNSFTSLSDEPGKDTQKANASSLKVQYDGNSNYQLTSTTSFADNTSHYDYDLDWQAFDEEKSNGTYQSTQTRQNFSQDFRWKSTDSSKLFNQSTDWLVGLYASHLTETNDRAERFQSCYGFTCPTEGPDIYNNDISSDFTNEKLALYGQLDQAISNQKTLSYSIRAEHNRKDFTQTKRNFGSAFEYDASGNVVGPHADFDYTLLDEHEPVETLWGGSITYTHKYNERHTAFAGFNRGFKASGFNTGQSTEQNLTFEAETLYNYEIGLRSNYGAIKTATTLFYMDRQNPQFDGYSYEPGGYEWVFFTENLDSAQHYGLETEIDWQVNSRWLVFANLGLLQTQVKGTPINEEFDMADRGAAHAPNYQYLIGGQYRHDQGWFGRVEVQGMDAFYFDNVHNEKSKAYTIANARIGYEAKDWEVYFWGKNLTDERYATRGYFFDHFDGDGEHQYIALGDPRQVGLTTRVRF
ncbi:TonB-dependent receptor [Thiomicrospira pelophila]|uniref:TonB-dependent receptor n=1 Tax=Thiomicrospira pelophila TaxID=934 RepID=UPI0004A759DC|nr:TonB-dependent receptor [Thiomicrospira pelophila]